MKVIRFSHRYKKPTYFPTGGVVRIAKLLEVIVVNLEDLSKPFLDFDTDSGLFPLPRSGKYIMLIFLKGVINEQSNLFTTLRPWDRAKETYYRNLIGQNINVQIMSEK